MRPFGTQGSAGRFHRIVRRGVVGPLLVLAMTVPAACGDQEPSKSKPQALSSSERGQVNQATDAIHAYCRRLRLYLTRRGGPPTGADRESALAATDRLIELAQEKPDALYQSQDPLRLLLDDLAEDLEGTNCSAEIEHRLNQALASLPPQ